MATKKPGLGKPLSALLGNRSAVSVADNEAGESSAGSEELRNLPIDLVERGRYQPRHDFDPTALQELADSIKAQGVVQPIVVRPLSQGNRFEIIAGERRWRAAQLAELHKIPAVVKDVTDQAAMPWG